MYVSIRLELAAHHIYVNGHVDARPYNAPMPKKIATHTKTPVSMRFDRELLARLDAYCENLKPVPADRTAVIEAFVRDGLDRAAKRPA